MLAYRLIRSPRKTIVLQVAVTGEVTVRAPLQAPLALIEQFVAGKRGWLERTQQRMAAKPQPLALRLEPNDEVPYLGVTLQLRWVAAGNKAERVRGVLMLPQGSLAERKAALINWYYEVAQPLFQAAVDEHFPYFAELGYERPKLHIKNMKTRWGSMSGKGNMSLNVNLMQLPLQCLHHIVVHELCHLVHMNHSPDFYALLEKRYPSWREADALMKNTSLLPLV